MTELERAKKELERMTQERDYLLRCNESIRARMNKALGLPEDGLWFDALRAFEKMAHVHRSRPPQTTP